MRAFRVNAAGLSDKGRVRAANEDSMILRDDVGLWAVADGMGGHANGKWASEQIAQALAAAPLGGEFDSDVRLIGEAVQRANDRILASSEHAGAVMGSTAAILFLSASRFAVFWAGDSRVYLYRDAALIRLTRDHTYVNELVAAGAITAAEAATHPDTHVISRAVGVAAALELDAIADQVVALDVFLLCSDGLTDLVSDEEIGDCLRRDPPPAAARRLLDLALSRGAHDNVTVLVVGCEEITKLTLATAGAGDV
ncbi:MAG TPA: PP2C family serine/threonine-protein phosphatase [Rhizomicrobium sp.]